MSNGEGRAVLAEESTATDASIDLRRLARSEAPLVLREALAAARAAAVTRLSEVLAEEIFSEARALAEGSQNAGVDTVSHDVPPCPRESKAGSPRDHAISGTGGRWLYAVSDTLPDCSKLIGIASAPVQGVSHGGLFALSSTVDDRLLAELGAAEQAVAASEESVVVRLARVHDQVVREAFDQIFLLPMRFGTVCRHDDDVRSMLKDYASTFTRDLDRLGGSREWRVVLSHSGQTSLSHFDQTSRRRPSTPPALSTSPGRDFLSRKRALSAMTQSGLTTEEIYATLGSLAVSSLRAEASPTARTGACAETRFYLVPHEREQDFAAAVDEFDGHLRKDGYDLEMTGPFPPYHFVTDQLQVQVHGR